MKNSRIKNGIMRIVQGIIIGAGAILPGISGGVLAVVFGIYRPAMELLTHPRRALQRYWRMLLAVGIGWAIGFLGGGSVILALFHQSETVATCLFIGLILGTLPDLWHEAGTQGRGNGSYISLIVSFLALFGALMAVKFSSFAEMPANFWGFLFCGVLWGFSFIIPGMTSSSILMAVGLLTPLIDGIAQLDFTVLVPWGAWHGRRDGAVCPYREQAFRHALLHRLSRRHRHRACLHAHHHSDGLCLDSGDGLERRVRHPRRGARVFWQQAPAAGRRGD